MSKAMEIAPWMQTQSGLAFDLLLPRIEQIELEDIAVSLDRLPRFNAHTKVIWTVAEHSHLVANLIPHVTDEEDPRLRLAALLHDAHEAYTGDITAPMKAALVALLGYDPLKEISRPIQRAIHAKFGLPAVLPDAWTKAIREADLTALHAEKVVFMSLEPRPWAPLPPLPQDVDGEIEAVEMYRIIMSGEGSPFQALVEKALAEISADA